MTGRTRETLKPGLRSVLAASYVVFYRVKDNGVEVARVLHQRRDLEAALSNDDNDG